MSNKRDALNLGAFIAKKAKADETHVAPTRSVAPTNPYLARPAIPEQAFYAFLTQSIQTAKKHLPKGITLPVKEHFCEIEARIGILKAPYGIHDRRVSSSGPKHCNGRTFSAFMCSEIEPRCFFESGITRTHNVHWTQAGLSELSPISHALGVTQEARLKQDIAENEYVETVYGGYPSDKRAVFPGVHPSEELKVIGKMEHKERLDCIDLAIPAAPYDVRIQLATEKSIDDNLQNAPPPGWTSKRVKRRRSYTRRDKSIKWQIDVTEVTTTFTDTNKPPEVAYELEMELLPEFTLHLVNDGNEKFCKMIATQLWWILHNINPLSDVLDVEEFLQDHPDQDEVHLALAACGAMKKFMETKGSEPFLSPIAHEKKIPKLAALSFCGCMPVNFSRHNIEEVQRSAENGYFLSEKTDGVRHFLVFTNKTAVLIDRAMRGKRPIHRPGADKEKDPFHSILGLIQPGTVLDGEVVMHRKHRRPIFIVFDVMTINSTTPVLQEKFEVRLQHLRRSSFCTPGTPRDAVFDPKAVADPKIALPLIRKNFVHRKDLDDLLANVTESKGLRAYRQGETHYHLTDGIIFQPNLPYVCGTDVNLLKWKYLDTVTIDVEIMPQFRNEEDDTLRVCVLGEDQTRIEMTRHIRLPVSERLRLEADRQENGSKIAEVGFDPSTGAWYYLTMRPDKVAPNHISTVLGTFLELAEYLTTEELRYRMSVPAGARDTYGKDSRGMQKQLLDHQRKKNNAARQHSKGH